MVNPAAMPVFIRTAIGIELVCVYCHVMMPLGVYFPHLIDQHAERVPALLALVHDHIEPDPQLKWAFDMLIGQYVRWQSVSPEG